MDPDSDPDPSIFVTDLQEAQKHVDPVDPNPDPQHWPKHLPICYKTKQRFLWRTDSENVGHFSGILIRRPTEGKGRVRSEKTMLNCD